MNNNLQRDAIAAAIDVLNEERVIAYPTEAVFGVGCDPDSETAVMRLLELKQRPVDKGLILIAANYEQLKPYINFTPFLPAESTLQPEGLLHTRGMAASGLRPLCNIPHCCLP